MVRAPDVGRKFTLSAGATGEVAEGAGARSDVGDICSWDELVEGADWSEGDIVIVPYEELQTRGTTKQLRGARREAATRGVWVRTEASSQSLGGGPHALLAIKHLPASLSKTCKFPGSWVPPRVVVGCEEFIRCRCGRAGSENDLDRRVEC